MSERRLRVLWVYHSAVVTEWRRTRVEALARHGVDVTVVSSQRWNEGGAVVEVEVAPDEDVRVAATVGQHPFVFAYDPRPLHRVLREERFDVIDVHEEPASLATAEVLAVSRLAGSRSPLVCYSAQNLFKRYPMPFRQLEHRALRRVCAVHVCDGAIEGVLRRKGFTGEVVNLGLGVDLGVFKPEDRAGHPVLRVGFVGRMEERKGIFSLLTAVSNLSDVHCTFVGAGPDESRLVAAVGARRLGDRVQVQGYVAHDDLPALYRGFDVLVVPSISNLSWTEQFGRVVVEAMGCGVPVIVSDAGSLPEVAGDAGVIVPEDDARALAEAIGRLAEDPALRADLRARGLERAKEFSWDRIAQRQAALYRRVAAASST